MPEFDFMTLFFAILAVVVAVRLYLTLGTHAPTDLDERGPLANLKRVATPAAGPEPRSATPNDEARWKGVAPAGSPVEQGLSAVAGADRNFDARIFIEGSRAAYGMIVEAFAAGDRESLRRLLAPDVFKRFSDAIDARVAAGRRASVKFVGAPTATIESASLSGAHAQVAVRFAASLISVVRDSSGTVVEGSADVPEQHSDLWTFSRDVRSADPNWTLLATEAAAAE